jgi:CubicO group peptidase (beta-lactamase class C family)
MKKPLFFAFFLVFVASSLSQAPASKDLKMEFEKKVDAYIRPYEQVHAFNGAILVARNGNVLLDKGYGMANYELSVPITPKSRFHIASVSKGFTAAAIMILQERGKLSVNDAVGKFVPDFPNGNKITLHQLLNHTSGLAGDLSSFNSWTVPITLEKLIELVKQAPPVAEPGVKYNYSNNGYRLLAFIIERVSGQSYDDFLRSAIFEPLKMLDTGHEGINGALVKNRAYGYSPVGISDLENIYIDWSTKTGNGSIYTTVEDLYKWDRALYTEKILKKTSIDTIFREKYGWFIADSPKRKLIRYSGRSPGYNSAIYRFVDDDVCVIVLANNYSSTVSQIADDLSAMVFDEPYQAPDLKPIAATPEELDSYAGYYEGGTTFFFPNVNITLVREGGALLMKWSSGAVAPMTPLAGSRFFVRPFGAIVSFKKNQRGEIDQLIYRYGGEDFMAKKAGVK